MARPARKHFSAQSSSARIWLDSIKPNKNWLELDSARNWKIFLARKTKFKSYFFTSKPNLRHYDSKLVKKWLELSQLHKMCKKRSFCEIGVGKNHGLTRKWLDSLENFMARLARKHFLARSSSARICLDLIKPDKKWLELDSARN